MSNNLYITVDNMENQEKKERITNGKIYLVQSRNHSNYSHVTKNLTDIALAIEEGHLVLDVSGLPQVTNVEILPKTQERPNE